MGKSLIKLILILSITTYFSCGKGSTPSQEEENPTEQNPTEQNPDGEDPDGEDPIDSRPEDEEPTGVVDETPTTFVLTFASDKAPTSVKFADLKYNKIAALSIDWDDGSITSLEAMKRFRELKYTDGTGKQIPWRAGVAVIGRSSYNDLEIGNTPQTGAIQYSDMRTILAAGWDIMNHGLYSGFGGNHKTESPKVDLEKLDNLLLARIKYKPTVTVVPNADNGYVEAAAELGHLAASSQRDDIGGKHKPHPEAEWKPLSDISTWEPGFKYLMRSFTDSWEVNDYMSKISDLVGNSNEKNHKLFRIGTHSSASKSFDGFIGVIAEKIGDNVLVCSMREFMEYEKLKSEAVISVDGQSITIKVPAGLRWEDFTLILEGVNVSNVNCPDADEVTYKGGMINVFKDNL